MKKKITVCVFFLAVNLCIKADNNIVFLQNLKLSFNQKYKDQIRQSSFTISPSDLLITNDCLIAHSHENKKITAIFLAIAIGPLGVHRIYLGTSPKVPIIYAITLGGMGILPLMDIITILTTNELSKFENNNKVLMWVK